MVPDPRRHSTGDGGGRRRCAGGGVRAEVHRARHPGRPRPGDRRPAGVTAVRSCRPRGRPGGRRATRPSDVRGSRHSSARRPCRNGRRCRRRPRPDRLLTDGRRLQDVRGPARLSHRHQPGIGRPGHGERRCRPRAGDARLDEPVGELVERPHAAHELVSPRSPPASSSSSPSSSSRHCSRTCPSRCSRR